MPISHGRCETCAYHAIPTPGTHNDPDRFLCRRHPPTADYSLGPLNLDNNGDIIGRWPSVDESDWCGHYQADTEAVAPTP